MNVIRFYSRQSLQLLKNQTVLKNCGIYGSLYVGAEFGQQLYLGNKNRSTLQKNFINFDWGLIRNYAILGYFVLGPTVSIWYQWLDRKYVAKSSQIVIKKLILDQFCLSPILLFLFFTGMSILKGEENVFDDFKKKCAKTFQVSCMFWIPVQTLNFLFVPAIYRVLFVGTCSFSWANILCWIQRQ